MSTKNSVKAVLVLALALLCAGASFAGARLVADYPDPIKIGDQVFAGGRLELVAVDNSPFIRLTINGRLVAVLSKDATGDLPDSGRIDLVFHGGPGEPKRLVAIQNFTVRPAQIEYRALQVAAIERSQTATVSAALK